MQKRAFSLVKSRLALRSPDVGVFVRHNAKMASNITGWFFGGALVIKAMTRPDQYLVEGGAPG